MSKNVSIIAYGVRALLVKVLFVVFLWPGLAGAAEPLRLLALGDSLTAGYGLAGDKSFPVQLQKALREKNYDVVVINAGVSGDTTAGGLARVDWALGDPVDAVIVELGANDGLRGIDPEVTLKNLDQLVGKIAARGLPVLLAGMYAPPNMGKEYGGEFNAIFPAVAKKHRALLYPFFLDGVAADPKLNQADGIHPTARGVAIIVRRILPSVTLLLDAARIK